MIVERRKRLALILFIIFLDNSAQAQGVGISTGADLERDCRAVELVSQGRSNRMEDQAGTMLCLGFIQGYIARQFMTQLEAKGANAVCLPSESGPSMGQYSEIFLRYAERHPLFGVGSGIAFDRALRDAFPCR